MRYVLPPIELGLNPALKISEDHFQHVAGLGSHEMAVMLDPMLTCRENSNQIRASLYIAAFCLQHPTLAELLMTELLARGTLDRLTQKEEDHVMSILGNYSDPRSQQAYKMALQDRKLRV